MVRFSIVIPLGIDRNAEILDSIKRLNYKNYEIIIKKGNNASKNRNLGAKMAKGDIIFFVDDDAYLDENILNLADRFFLNNPNIDLVGGPQLSPKSDGIFARISGYALSSYFGSSSMRYRYKKGKLNLDVDSDYLTSANCFIKKTSFKNIGDFKVDLYPGEDIEFLERAKSKGFKLAYNPDLVVYHKRRKNPYLFAKQIFNYGKVVFPRVKKYNQKLNSLLIVPSLFVLYLVLLPFLYFIDTLFLLPLFLYLLIIFIYSLFISIRNLDVLALIILPFSFLLMHFSYGVGFIYGLVHKVYK